MQRFDNGNCLVCGPSPHYVTKYYQYVANLFGQALKETNQKINVAIATECDFGNSNKTLKVDIQYEHTLVRPGGRDLDKVLIGGIAGYLVRVCSLQHLLSLDIIIEYSLPNIANIKTAYLNEYVNKAVYVAPLIYDDVKHDKRNRGVDCITTFCRIEDRRKAPSQAIAPINLSCFEKEPLQKHFLDAKTMLYVHQTPHHRTYEELTVLPALMNGVLIISEDDIPLKELIPYSDYIIWADYKDLVEVYKDVINNYDKCWNKIFVEGNLKNILLKLKEDNLANIKRAIDNLMRFCPAQPQHMN